MQEMTFLLCRSHYKPKPPDPDNLAVLPGTFSEYWETGACSLCGDDFNGGVPIPTDPQPAIDSILLFLRANLPWPEEGVKVSLQALVEARLALGVEVPLRCSLCSDPIPTARLEVRPGRVSLVFLSRAMFPPREDPTRRQFCPGGMCSADSPCPGHGLALKNPTPVSEPDPTSPVFEGKELVAVVGHQGKYRGGGHWLTWVKQGGQWFVVDSLSGNGALVPEDPFQKQQGGGGQNDSNVTLDLFAFQ